MVFSGKYELEQGGNGIYVAYWEMILAALVRDDLNRGMRAFCFFLAGIFLSLIGITDAATSRDYVWDISFPLERNAATYASGWHLCRPSASSCTRAHRAVDLYAIPGTPVYAAADGVISWRQTSASGNWSPVSGSGYSMMIRGAEKTFYHFYGHFGPHERRREGQAFAVNPGTGELWKVGDEVQRGQHLGYVGTSGATASGPHLHFELRSMQRGLPLDDPGDDGKAGRNYGDPAKSLGAFEALRYDPYPSLVAAEERNDYPADSGGDFTADNFVKVIGVNNALNVRGPQPCGSPVLGAAQPLGAVGRIIGGPVLCPEVSSYPMWRIQWEDCQVGWSSQLHLQRTEAPEESCTEEIPGLIIDNDQAGFHAVPGWATELAGTEKYGANFRFRRVSASGDFASWTAHLPYPGDYQVYAWWSARPNYATGAPYLVMHADGMAEVSANQTKNGGRWNSLGTYRFGEGSAQVKILPSSSGGSIVVADAVRFIALDFPPPTPYTLTLESRGSGIVEGNPAREAYRENEAVQLTAVPFDGFDFISWSGDLEGGINPANIIIDRNLAITALFARTYQAWERFQFTETEREIPGFTDPGSDPLGIGLSNLLLYAFGADARAPNRDNLPRMEWSDETGKFIFHRLKEAADLRFALEISTDLIEWSRFDLAGLQKEVMDASGPVERVVVSVPLSSTDRHFVRLRVQRQPLG